MLFGSTADGAGRSDPASEMIGFTRIVVTARAAANVLKTLRAQGNQMHMVSLPMKKYTYRNGHEEIARYSLNGIYGTWEQLGSAIKGSSEAYYGQIVQAINSHPGCRVDVLLGYNADNSRHTWNGVVRIINQDNKVVWTAKRYGNQMATWSMQEIEPRNQPDAGNDAPNYAPPQPEVPRERRPRGQAAQAAPAGAPAQQGNLGELNVFRQQSQHSDELYVVPNNALVQALQTAGFTNLAADFERNNNGRWHAVIYKACPHRAAATEYVALIYGGAQTMVAGYPQNHAAGEVGINSTRWRDLTRELDNSIYTFGQCRDICREKHIPLPQAIEAWLVHRGEA